MVSQYGVLPANSLLCPLLMVRQYGVLPANSLFCPLLIVSKCGVFPIIRLLCLLLSPTLVSCMLSICCVRYLWLDCVMCPLLTAIVFSLILTISQCVVFLTDYALYPYKDSACCLSTTGIQSVYCLPYCQCVVSLVVSVLSPLLSMCCFPY